MGTMQNLEPAAPAASATSGAGWQPPARIEHYAVLRPLGLGGMGHVYLGRDLGLDDAALRQRALVLAAGAAPGQTVMDEGAGALLSGVPPERRTPSSSRL